MPGGKVAAGFIIFRRISTNIQYLMMQTSYGKHHWTPPKGHVDPEDPNELETAYRETWEEAGLKKDDLKVYENCKDILKYNVKGKPKTVIYWLAELINPDAQVKMSDEHQDFKWLELESACEISGYQDMNDTLVQFDQFVKSKI